MFPAFFLRVHLERRLAVRRHTSGLLQGTPRHRRGLPPMCYAGSGIPRREYAHIGRRDAISPRARRRHCAPTVILPPSMPPPAPNGFSPLPPRSPMRGRRLRKISLACQGEQQLILGGNMARVYTLDLS
jgi:hypothetical protein